MSTHAGGDVRAIAVCNLKGGVGKTTTSLNLGVGLAQVGKRVLLIDCDPQGNLTNWLGVVPSAGHPCLADILRGRATVAAAAVESGWPGIMVLPASSRLDDINRRNLAGERVLLARMRPDWDYVILDCPTAVGVVLVNALTAATEVIAPVQAGGMAIEGIRRLIGLLEELRLHGNPRLDVTGILVNHFDGRTRLCAHVVDRLRDVYGPLVFDTVIHTAVRLSEAADFHMPISHFDPGGRCAREFAALTAEIIGRPLQGISYFGAPETARPAPSWARRRVGLDSRLPVGVSAHHPSADPSAD
jgi:chromosome partitioning protein